MPQHKTTTGGGRTECNAEVVFTAWQAYHLRDHKTLGYSGGSIGVTKECLHDRAWSSSV